MLEAPHSHRARQACSVAGTPEMPSTTVTFELKGAADFLKALAALVTRPYHACASPGTADQEPASCSSSTGGPCVPSGLKHSQHLFFDIADAACDSSCEKLIHHTTIAGNMQVGLK